MALHDGELNPSATGTSMISVRGGANGYVNSAGNYIEMGGTSRTANGLQ